MESIIVALITGGLALVGVIITNVQGNRKMEQQLVTAQAITDTKITTLTAEVKKHNDFGNRIPVIENEVKNIKSEIDELKREVKSRE